jgi:catechol 2,3-dioxygenase
VNQYSTTGDVMVDQILDTAEEVRFKPRRLAHANLYVSDTPGSVDFYNKVCGFEVVRRAPTVRSASLSNGNTHHDLGLPQVRGGRPPGLNHLGWEMENEAELVAAYHRARQARLKIDRTMDHVVSRSVYVSDPEGNAHEFYADLLPDWREIIGQIDVSPNWTPGEPPPSVERHYHVNPEMRRVEDAVFHPRCITHAALVATDFAGMLRFFTDIAGMEIAFRAPDDMCAVLSGTCGGRDLALFQATAALPAGLHHIGFKVEDEGDLDEAVERLGKIGLEPAIQLDHVMKRNIFVRDPDGLLLEFYCDRSAALGTLTELEAGVALHLV